MKVSVHVILNLVVGLSMWLSAASSFGTVITLISGNGEIGEVDPLNEWSGDGGLTFTGAIIAEPFESYHVIPGTHHIARNANLTSPSYASTMYRTTFDLPVGYQDPYLFISLHADNVATIYLNGSIIGQQPMEEAYPNFRDPADEFDTADAALFVEGQNTLTVDVYNYSLYSALDYLAEVSYTPEPGSLILLVVGFGVVAKTRKRIL